MPVSLNIPAAFSELVVRRATVGTFRSRRALQVVSWPRAHTRVYAQRPNTQDTAVSRQPRPAHRSLSTETPDTSSPTDGWFSPEHGYPHWLADKVARSAIWIRDCCPCEACVSPSSGQKTFSTTDIPATIRPRSVRLSPTFDLTIQWDNDIPSFPPGHESVYPASTLDQLRFRSPTTPFAVPDRTVPFQPWTSQSLTADLLKLPYTSFLTLPSSLHLALLTLSSQGIFLLTSVPPSPSSISTIALRIANLQETLYGRTWDVVSKPQAENVAYTNSYLGLHMDMLYLQSPPRIQLLHCVENSCEGGESLFSDARNAVAAMIRSPWYGEDVNALATYPVRYHYQKHPYTYRTARPVLEFQDPVESMSPSSASPAISPTRPNNPPMAQQRLVNIWWSPPFQGPNTPYMMDTDSAGYRAWHRAAQRFSALIAHEDNVFEYKMQPGECVVFDNRRVLHGRKAFDTGSGTRWLRGTYIADEDFRSRMASIPREEVAGYVAERGLVSGGELGEERHSGMSLMEYLSRPGP